MHAFALGHFPLSLQWYFGSKSARFHEASESNTKMYGDVISPNDILSFCFSLIFPFPFSCRRMFEFSLMSILSCTLSGLN